MELPWHYALSDGLIVTVVFWAIYHLRHRETILRFAVGSLGVAAAIGTIRIGLGFGAQLAGLHQIVSKCAGLTAFALMLLELTHPAMHKLRPHRILLLIGVMCLSALLLPPKLYPIVIVGLLVAAFVLALKRFQAGYPKNLFLPLAFVVFLVNVILIRQSQSLGADVSWHLYHGLVAAGLVLLTLGWPGEPKSQRVRSPISHFPHKPLLSERSC